MWTPYIQEEVTMFSAGVDRDKAYTYLMLKTTAWNVEKTKGSSRWERKGGEIRGWNLNNRKWLEVIDTQKLAINFGEWRKQKAIKKRVIRLGKWVIWEFFSRHVVCSSKLYTRTLWFPSSVCVGVREWVILCETSTTTTNSQRTIMVTISRLHQMITTLMHRLMVGNQLSSE